MFSLALTAFVAFVVIAVVLVLVGHPRLADSVATVSEEEVFGEDAAALEEAFAAVEAEGVERRRHLVWARVEHLRSHEVPLRRITTAPTPEVARLGFADGTGLLAKSPVVGDVATLVRLHHLGGLVIDAYADHAEGLIVEFRSPRRSKRGTLIVVALDQAD